MDLFFTTHGGGFTLSLFIAELVWFDPTWNRIESSIAVADTLSTRPLIDCI